MHVSSVIAHRAASGRSAAIVPREMPPIVRAASGHAASTVASGHVASIVAGGQVVAATGRLVVATAVRGAVRRDAAKRE